MNIVKLSALLLLLPYFSDAQDISGKWEGNYTWNFFTTRPQQLVAELFVHDDSLIAGATHLYYGGGKYEHYKINGVYHKKDSTVYFSEDSTLSVFLGSMATNCLGNYQMKLTITDTSWRLEGKWRDNDRSFIHCPTTGAWLEKPVKKKETPIVKPKDKNLQRAADIQRIIEVATSERDSIKIEVFDNAQIDGDVISLYVNDSTIVSKQKIIATPIVFYLSLGKDEPLSKIQMAAESMGSVPPCTAHMIITTKHNRYETDLSSSYSNNGIVELFLKE